MKWDGVFMANLPPWPPRGALSGGSAFEIVVTHIRRSGGFGKPGAAAERHASCAVSNRAKRVRKAAGMDATATIGGLAALCSTASFAPQVWKIFRTRDVHAISRRMYVLTVTGFALWTTYGWLLGAWPLMLSNGICLVLSGAILAATLVLPRVDDVKSD
jgi:MtN3 and saliva related transmembrane protein